MNRLQLLGDGEPVRTGLVRSEFDALLEPRDADFEELIEVVGRDAEELQALEQRNPFVQCLCQYPLVEGEQGQFAVDVVFRGAEIRQVHENVLSRVSL